MRVMLTLKRLARISTQFEEAVQKCLKVAVIGPPNIGKSLLTNRLVRANVAAVSSQMDTTQRNQIAVITEGQSQLVFVDSPGAVGIKHAREVIKRPQGRILTDPEVALDESDHILVVHDATISTDYILHRILHMLHRHRHIPSSLVINKIDLIAQRPDLLALTRVICNGVVGGKPIVVRKHKFGYLEKLCGKPIKSSAEITLHTEEEKMQDEKWQEKYRNLMEKPTSKCGWTETKSLFIDVKGWSYFQAVFFVSALTGEGIDPLRSHLYQLGQNKDHSFSRETVTTKAPQIICQDAIRAEFLNTIPPYIAYTLKVKVHEWQLDGDVLQIVAVVDCEKARIARVVVGKRGETLIEVARRVNESVQNLLGQQLFIRILVKVNGKLYDSQADLRQREEERK